MSYLIDQLLPLVSFAIPTHNSERTLEMCLRSIKVQDYPRIEIVIVDKYSGDKTLRIARKFTDKIYLCDGPLGAQRQRSIEKSSGEIVALFDSDIILPHNMWLFNTVKQFLSHGPKLGSMDTMNLSLPGSSIFTRLYVAFYNEVIRWKLRMGRGMLGGGGSLYWRDVILKTGGINKEMSAGEDFELMKSISKMGYIVAVAREPVFHNTHTSFTEIVRKEFERSKQFKHYGISELTGLSLRELIAQHLFIALRGTLWYSVRDRELAWLIFPIYLLIRALAFLAS